MRSRYALVIAALLAATFASCNCDHGARTACANNASCPSGEVCQGGFCVAPGTDGGPTGRDAGPGSNPDSGPQCVNLQCQQQGCYDGGTTSLTGTVFDPSGNLPLYNALVYVPNGPVKPLTTGVSCDVCGAFATGEPLVIALTGPDGTFQLTNVPVGSNIPLVVQIGKWRRQVTVPSVPACTNTPVDATLTRLPRTWSGHPGGGEGDIPHIAIASGSADPFECLLLKMGVGSEIQEAGQGGRIDYYRENGVPMSANTPTGTQLYSSLDTLNGYDIVLLPCEGRANAKSAQAEQNIVDYTNDGGRIFTTHYGYEWLAPGWGAAPFPSTASWCPADNGTCPSQENSDPNDGIKVAINTGFPKAQAFYQWLGGAQINALDGQGRLAISQPRWNVGKVNATAPAYVEPTAAWMFGDHGADWTGSTPYNWTPHFTFNTPYDPPPLADGDAGLQCGRLVYSDFHVDANDQVNGCANFADAGCRFPSECVAGQPYTAQEKALIFMLFDLSSCIQSDQTPPTVCHGIGGDCSASQGCCQGLLCLDGLGQACTAPDGGGCTCEPVIP